MGLAIDLRVANWLAAILAPNGRYVSLDSPFEEREALRYFLHQVRTQFISTRNSEELSWQLGRLESLIENVESDRGSSTQSAHAFETALAFLRDFFSDRPWTALLVPSMRNYNLDRRLCSPELLERLVYMAPGHPGLIIQLQRSRVR